MLLRQALFVAAAMLAIGAANAIGQSITTGSVTGVITDPSGSAIPEAAVMLTNTETNVVRKTATNGSGRYQFAFAAPGSYQLEVAATGFQTGQRGGVIVMAGQPVAGNFQLQVAGAAQEVTVTGGAAVIQTENADIATDYNSETIVNLPNPGGDLTYIAQTAPGVVMNTQSGYGNFSANGMPAISNLFTVNGQNYNDPFAGINVSGASNLLLGSNDIAEANVINNAYSAQYGQYAGSQISYITKSGTNQFHGNANYMWNGRALNANQFFSNESGEPKPFNNFNEWQAGAQGPIRKDHTFFDADYEGFRNVLPTSSALTLIPSQPFQAATLTNLTAMGHSDEIPFYKQLFAIYNNAPGAGAAIPVSARGGCGNFTSDLLPAGAPCAVQFRSTPPNTNREYQWSGRVDHTFGPNDRGYVRVLRDNGFQPTFTSPLSPTFNIQSNQPQMSGQVSEIHTFGTNAVNQFNGSALFYGAVFTPSDPGGALAALPTYVHFSGGVLSDAGGYATPGGFFYPNGRRVFQYQALDDFSMVRGKHTFRLGFTWLHDTITDLDFEGVGGPTHGAVITTLADFFNGGGTNTSLVQAFPSAPEQTMRFSTLSGYMADDWKVSDRLTISVNLRLEHYANPTCDGRCFSRLESEFSGSPNPGAASAPYNQMIITGQKNPYVNTQAVAWEPRLGIAWRPLHWERTVVRMGAGIFADQLPGGLAEAAAFNTPGFNAFTIGGVAAAAIAPGARGNLFTTAAQANQALLSGFQSGGSFNSISQTVPDFAPPTLISFPNLLPAPRYYKWNLEIEQAVGLKSVLAVNYSGMHGSHIPVADEGLNAYCPDAVCPGGFGGLPTAAANRALGPVDQYLSAGSANYHGLTVSLRRRVSNSLTYSLNYTWSHALDDVSNGGISNEPFSALGTNGSVVAPQNPRDIRANYGSSDYDARHYFSASFMLTDVFRQAGLRRGPNRIFGGWTLSGNWFFRTGLPFTIVDSGTSGGLLGFNYVGTIFATPVASVPRSCGNAVDSPCLSASQFVSSADASSLGTIGRNTVYGPHFFDVDLALMKSVALGERATFSFGAQAYNLFNHPNFDQPVGDIASPLFGSTVATVGPPTSLLGAFNGAGSSPRFVEIKGTVRF